MCGVFGYISVDGRGPSIRHLRAMALDTESRGKHAHGLAWIDRNGRLRRYKSPGPISKNLGCLHALKGAKMVIGHCRYTTTGPASDNGNNHPHPSDGGWIVHNGTIFNSDRLAFEWELPVATECDSEVLGLLIEDQYGSLLDRTKASVNLLEGPAVMLGLWSRPARMIVARRGKPLHITTDKHGNVSIASLPSAIKNPYRVLDNTVRTLTVRDEEVHQMVDNVKPCKRRKPERNPRLGRELRKYDSAWS